MFKFKYAINLLKNWWNNKADRVRIVASLFACLLVAGLLINISSRFTSKRMGYTTVGPAFNPFQDIGPKTTPEINILDLAANLSPNAFVEAEAILAKGLKRVKSIAVQTPLSCWIHCITTRAREGGKFADFNDDAKLLNWSCALSNQKLASKIADSMTSEDQTKFMDLANRIYENSIQADVEAVAPLYNFACTVRTWLDNHPEDIPLFVYTSKKANSYNNNVLAERNYQLLKATTKDFESNPMAMVEFNRHSRHEQNPKSLWELFDDYCKQTESTKSVTRFLNLYKVLDSQKLLRFVKKELGELEFYVRIDFHWIYLKVFRTMNASDLSDDDNAPKYSFIHQWYDSSMYIQHNLTIPAYGRLKYQFSLLVQMAIQEAIACQAAVVM